MIGPQPTGRQGGWVTISTAWLIIPTNTTTAVSREARPTASAQQPVFFLSQKCFHLDLTPMFPSLLPNMSQQHVEGIYSSVRPTESLMITSMSAAITAS